MACRSPNNAKGIWKQTTKGLDFSKEILVNKILVWHIFISIENNHEKSINSINDKLAIYFLINNQARSIIKKILYDMKTSRKSGLTPNITKVRVVRYLSNHSIASMFFVVSPLFLGGLHIIMHNISNFTLVKLLY